MNDILLTIASLILNAILLYCVITQSRTIKRQSEKLDEYAKEESRNNTKRFSKEVRFVDVRHCDQNVLDKRVTQIQADGFDFYKDGSGNGLLAFRKYTEIEGEGA